MSAISPVIAGDTADDVMDELFRIIPRNSEVGRERGYETLRKIKIDLKDGACELTEEHINKIVLILGTYQGSVKILRSFAEKVKYICSACLFDMERNYRFPPIVFVFSALLLIYRFASNDVHVQEDERKLFQEEVRNFLEVISKRCPPNEIISILGKLQGIIAKFNVVWLREAASCLVAEVK